MIDQGSEDPQNPNWEDDGSKIVHFDLKIENSMFLPFRLKCSWLILVVLVGDITTDSEHNDGPIYKVCIT